jgi:2-dehydropantoate 2-reductase
MKVLAIGAGAMGTLFGTTLVKAGHDVTFLASWQPLVYAVSRDPYARLMVNSTIEKIPVKLVSTAAPPSGGFDLVIIFVKSSATQNAMKNLESGSVLTDKTVILTLQGGVECPDIIARGIPNGQLLLTGSTSSFSKSSGPMAIEHFGLHETLVWPHLCSKDADPLPRIRDVVAACARSGLQMELTPRAITDRWNMLLAFPANSAVSAVADLDYGTVWATDEGRALVIEIAKEVALVAKLDGIDDTLFNQQIAVQTVARLAQENPNRPGTLLIDCKAHRLTEVDATIGALIRRAKSHGAQVPLMFGLWSVLRLKEQNYGNEFEG